MTAAVTPLSTQPSDENKFSLIIVSSVSMTISLGAVSNGIVPWVAQAVVTTRHELCCGREPQTVVSLSFVFAKSRPCESVLSDSSDLRCGSSSWNNISCTESPSSVQFSVHTEWCVPVRNTIPSWNHKRRIPVWFPWILCGSACGGACAPLASWRLRVVPVWDRSLFGISAPDSFRFRGSCVGPGSCVLVQVPVRSQGS